ncbi:MAG: CHAD domain-containing protein [Blastocatellia bacterium]
MVEIKDALIEDINSAPAAEITAKKPRAIADILTFQLQALQTFHRAVLETDEPEAIHKMRVTTRRAQAALDLLEGELRVRKLKRRLREWRQMLSRVRNYDVFLMFIEKEMIRSRTSYRAQLVLLKSIFEKRRAHRAEKARKYFEKIKVDSISSKLGLTITQPAIGTDEDTGSQKGFTIDEQRVFAHVADRLEQRVAEFQTLAAQAHPATRAEELHMLRIAAKRVRYLLEIISQMGFGDATRAVVWLRNVQDRIGDWHDLESLEEEIIEIVSHRQFLKEHLAESSRMLQAAAHLQKKKERLVTKLFPVRVPRSIALTSQRMERALRRNAHQTAPKNDNQ